ncbi:MAG: PilN domain-containing protein [Candidatus Woykebacteria bacterium]
MWPFGKSKDINLIPEEERAARNRNIAIIIISSFAVLVGLGVVVYSFFAVLEARDKNTQSRLSTEIQEKNSQWQQFAPVLSNLKKVKTKLSVYQTYLSNSSIDKYIEKIRSTVPKGIVLDNLAVDKEGKLKISGKGEVASVYQFFEVLQEKSAEFESPTLVSVDKISGSDYSFNIEAKVKN